jgi:hypothetical protein
MSRRRRSTLAYALACLADPLTLAAIGLLLLNDHVLKPTIPSWLTGKLSDILLSLPDPRGYGLA